MAHKSHLILHLYLNKYWSVPIFQPNYFSSMCFGREKSETRQVEQNRLTLIKKTFVIRILFCHLLTTNAVTIFDFEKPDQGSLVVTPRMEVDTFPSMYRSTVKKNGTQSRIADQSIQVLFFLFSVAQFELSRKLSIKEVRIGVSDLHWLNALMVLLSWFQISSSIFFLKD